MKISANDRPLKLLFRLLLCGWNWVAVKRRGRTQRICLHLMDQSIVSETGHGNSTYGREMTVINLVSTTPRFYRIKVMSGTSINFKSQEKLHTQKVNLHIFVWLFDSLHYFIILKILNLRTMDEIFFFSFFFCFHREINWDFFCWEKALIETAWKFRWLWKSVCEMCTKSVKILSSKFLEIII